MNLEYYLTPTTMVNGIQEVIQKNYNLKKRSHSIENWSLRPIGTMKEISNFKIFLIRAMVSYK